MAKSTEVTAKATDDVAIQTQEDFEAQLAAENMEQSDAADMQIPLLKIGQALTDEVTAGDAAAGEFINALTREGLGRDIEFVVAGKQKGRFDHGVRGERKARKAYGQVTVPWNDDPFFNRPFTEHPDAEETYSKRANAGEIEWGKGPRISTTYDFTGFVVPEDTDEEPIPVCLSLMRMNSKQAKKWITILDAVLRGRYWDAVFKLTTEQQKSDGNNFYVINVKQTRKTTSEEKQRAVTLAQILRNTTVQVVGDDDSLKPAPEPADTGGLAV